MKQVWVNKRVSVFKIAFKININFICVLRRCNNIKIIGISGCY